MVCDLHPDYASTRHAERLAARWDVPLLRVQHHHAHVAACMAEHGLQGPVLGFSWDGTGYGPDGTVWGGEVLAVRGGGVPPRGPSAHVPAARRRSRRARAAALGPRAALRDASASSAAEHAAEPGSARARSTRCSRCWRGDVNSPRTSSMGRLFDAVAAICGLPPVISFEGQAAMALEFAADEQERAATRCRSLLASKPLAALSECRDDRAMHGWPIGSRWCARVLADRAAGVPVGARSAPASTTPWPRWPWRSPRVAAARGCRSCSPAAVFKTPCLRERVRCAAVGGRLSGVYS